MEKTSRRRLKISSLNDEYVLDLFNFKRFNDDSSIYFELFCKSNSFEIKNFDFFADFNSFKLFISKFKEIYTKLSGEAIIETSYENDIVKIIALNNGHIQIHCEVHKADEFCRIKFCLDQTYLSNLITEIDLIYEDLELL